MTSLAYVIDDVLRFVSNEVQHDEHLKKILHGLAESNVTLNKPKCLFGVKDVFYSHHLSAEGLRPDSQRIAAVKNMKTPSDVSEVRSILKMANHFDQRLLNLAQKTPLLRELLKMSTEWGWGPAQETA